MNAASGAARCRSDPHASLAAAYREGLRLATIVVISNRAGVRIACCGHDRAAAGQDESVEARWWCRRAAEAARIVAAAKAAMRRESSGVSAAAAGVADDSTMIARARAAVLAAADRCGVALRTDEDIAVEALGALARVDAQLRKLRDSGGLKPVNTAYRTYRLEISGRGERVLPYGEWMRQYRENLVRELAATLRSL